MTEKKKPQEDHEKISDEELEAVVGGATAIEYGLIAALKGTRIPPKQISLKQKNTES